MPAAAYGPTKKVFAIYQKARNFWLMPPEIR
jgi:hypothetical protein